MTTFTTTIYRIAELTRWWERDELTLQPKFQKRAVWEEKARSYLIDTIVRGLPMPKIYLRRIFHPITGRPIHEVVDGQQRLRAIIDFCSGRLILRRQHNEYFGDATFDSLPESVRSEFLEYALSTEVMNDAEDSDVWALFERLNTYTLTLNRQERLNAKYFGYFKQAAYQLASEESALNTWQSMGVFGNQQIDRMKEVELTSDVLVAIVKGISDIIAIEQAYREFDEQFPLEGEYRERFRTSLRYVDRNLGGVVRTTRFRNRAWFYSLLVAVADATFGIPGGQGPRALAEASDIGARMRALDIALKPTEVPPGLGRLRGALSRATSHVPERRVRHREFLAMLTLGPDAWPLKWAEFTGESPLLGSR